MTSVSQSEATNGNGTAQPVNGFCKTDAGRHSAGILESNDCTVRAFANAAGCGYERAWAALRSNGRKSGRGVNLKKIAQDVARSLGIEIKLIRRSGTLRRLIADFPDTKMIVRVRQHAFAVMNGVVLDTTQQSPNRRIKSAWKIA